MAATMPAAAMPVRLTVPEVAELLGAGVGSVASRVSMGGSTATVGGVVVVEQDASGSHSSPGVTSPIISQPALAPEAPAVQALLRKRARIDVR